MERLNGHAALHMLQPHAVPRRVDAVERELNRRTQRLARGGQVGNSKTRESVPVTLPTFPNLAASRSSIWPWLIETTVDLGLPSGTLATQPRKSGGGTKSRVKAPAAPPIPAPTAPAAPEADPKRRPAEPPLARRKARVAAHKPNVVNNQGKRAGSGSGKAGRKQLPKPQAAPATKKELVLTLLRRKQGATMAELIQATGWQSHSVRGFLSRAISKKMALKVRSGKRSDGVRVYSVNG